MDIKEILTPPKVVAVVGLSDKPDRPSHEVGLYLIDHGFTVIPVNPNISDFHGQHSYTSLADIPSDVHIDIVDIFRKSEDVPEIIDQVLALHWMPIIWMQEGVVSTQAKETAEKNGLQVIMDSCMMKEHRKLF
ncbi:MAG TPA: CoA-binding protein [Patescibacteria group bacterium]|nr:CoA-binding protein [Patescibacteria group bacterium]